MTLKPDVLYHNVFDTTAIHPSPCSRLESGRDLLKSLAGKKWRQSEKFLDGNLNNYQSNLAFTNVQL